MELVHITAENWETAAELTSNADGIPTLYEPFIASNAYSMLQSVFEPGWNIRGIAENGTLIGFTMFGRQPEENFYEICRFMIDRRFQGCGRGRAALHLLVDLIRRQDAPERIYISAEPENERALHLYRSMGFQDTGRLLEGEVLLCLTGSQNV